MTYKNFHIIIYCFIFYQQLCGVDYSPLILEITPLNMEDKVAKFQTDVPEEAMTEVQNNLDLILYLVKMPDNFFEIAEKLKKARVVIKETGSDLGGTSFVWKSNNWVIKISSYGHRVRNLLRACSSNKIEAIAAKNEAFAQMLKDHQANAPWYGFHDAILNREELNELIDIKPTYQTASSFPYFLLASNSNDGEIIIPPTYIVRIDSAKGFDDENTAIIQRFVPGLIKFKDYLKTDPDYFDNHPAALKSLVGIITNGLVWDIEENLMIKPDSQKLYIVDLEQPNIVTPDEEFFKDICRRERCVKNGIKELNKIICDAGRDYQDVVNRYIHAEEAG